MNQFFLKNIISPKSNPSQQQDEQSDFDRLLELCNSYGLNEQQTKQLIEEFKKGPYTKSGANSANQSMLSETSMCENDDDNQIFHLHKLPQSKKDNLNHLYKQQQQNNFYQHQPQHQTSHDDICEGSNQGDSTNRYYGYDNNDKCYKGQNQHSNQHEDDDDQSLNEMTFNQQNNTITAIQLYQRAEINAGLNRKQVNANQTKTPIQGKKCGNQNIMQFIDPTLNKASKSSLSTKIQPQSQRLSSHQESRISQHQVSKSSQNSHEHQHSFQTENQLNPLYVRQLIINFELLQKESEMLKQQNLKLTAKNQQINKHNEMVIIQAQKIRRERQEIAIKDNKRQAEMQRLSTLLQAQKQKTLMLASMKHHDSEIINGLKDSIIHLTEFIKEKDTQNNQLQKKMFNLYQKMEKQSFANQQINYTGGSMSRVFNKVVSSKSLVSEEGEREEEKSTVKEQKKQRERIPNYGRRQLTELILNNMNTQQSQSLIPSQSNKSLVRGDVSTSKTGSSGSEQPNQQKHSLPMPQHQRQVQQQCKQNAFIGLQVEQRKKCRQVIEQCGSTKGLHEQSRKRGSSRVDIKKYKGMIEQLRNSCSNVGGMR